jgi:hypothetical protein
MDNARANRETNSGSQSLPASIRALGDAAWRRVRATRGSEGPLAKRARLLRLAPLYVTLAGALLLPIPAAAAEGTSRQAFGFNGSVSGFPTGAVTLTGGGAYDPNVADNVAGGFVNSSGGFRCTADVSQGPLSVSVNPDDPGKCVAGQGVRWDTAQLLHDTRFKCTGAATEVAQTATTSKTVVVLQADLYRAGDANDESFTAKMILTAGDLPGHPGQNMWLEGVGCGTAVVNFAGAPS